jgi:hypothetical protein
MVLSIVADREGTITRRREVLVLVLRQKARHGCQLDLPLSLLKQIFSYDKAWSSDLRWAVAKATRNTVFKVIYFKEALSIEL